MLKLVFWMSGAAAVLYGLARIALPGDEAARYITAPVERGSIVDVTTVTGTVVPVVEVEVGSQLSGQISEILVDFNDMVEKGQPIARLDPQEFQARHREARAELVTAEAALEMRRAALIRAQASSLAAEADLAMARARQDRAMTLSEGGRRSLERAERLRDQGIVSNDRMDQAETDFGAAEADVRASAAEIEKLTAAIAGAEAEVAIARADIRTAEAEVERKQALLDRAAVDLERSTIRAPISGIVISRDVDTGQTVAASLEAPTLFVIAQSLERMKVHARVDEADIGRVRAGQRAIFTVDAFRDRYFSGEVIEIRKAPRISQNVVTYTVVISARNPGQMLLPGMTAVVDVETMRADDVLKIPNAALRFRPKGAGAEAPEVPAGPGVPGLVWVDDGGTPVPHPIRIGARDGHAAAITAGTLDPGTELIVGVAPGEP